MHATYEKLSYTQENLNGDINFSNAKYVFSRLKDRCPQYYTERKLSARMAAKLLDIDHKTIFQRLKSGKLEHEKTIEKGRNIYKISVRDLSDMLINYPFTNKCLHQTYRLWAKEEEKELILTGVCKGRSKTQCKSKKHMLKFRKKNDKLNSSSSSIS